MIPKLYLSPDSLPSTSAGAEVYPAIPDFSAPDTLRALFDMSEIADGITVSVSPQEKQLHFCSVINDTDFSLTIDLSGAEGHTALPQIVSAAKLFWYCYPQMYARFGHDGIPTAVVLRIENFGYGIAEAWDNQVHIHDQWLRDCPLDVDCLTHEFAHTVQGDWLEQSMPFHEDDSYMVERFADYCRYLYSYQNGRYNDLTWQLQTSRSENTYYDSVRFWVWLDYTYSTPERDIIRYMNLLFFETDPRYRTANWAPDGTAWQEVFAGTGAEGKDLLSLWDEFTASEMANLPSDVQNEGEVSPLLQAVPLRDALRARYPEAARYLKVR